MFLSEDEVQAFRDKGFIVSKGFFDAGIMAQVSRWLDNLRDKPEEETGEARFYETSTITGEAILVRIEDLFDGRNPDIAELLVSARATGCLAALFGEPPVLFKEKINYKLPGCRADKLHQDQAAGWNRYCDFFITMGIVVDANRKENAALSFMKSGDYARALMTREWRPLSEDDPPYAPRDDYVLLEADPGDVIFFDSYVPHGSPPNTGTRSRRNIFLTFNRQSDGDMRARYYADKRASYPPNDIASARPAETYRV